ncbi:hypothetical protein LZ31DRAFT_558184 [Colletotrichum somersetense]|nr:hypothetical protein LZ31DRAFT_558184 [Colletotrichum somersetense]
MLSSVAARRNFNVTASTVTFVPESQAHSRVRFCACSYCGRVSPETGLEVNISVDILFEFLGALLLAKLTP